MKMREIKFRGFDEENGLWRFGLLIKVKVRDGYSYAIEFFEHNDHLSTHLVKQETVGQYTGLKDKDDKEIYEGDIVNCRRFFDESENYEKGVIWYNFSTCYTLCAFYIEVSPSTHSTHCLLGEDLEIEVIGNIHEHKELLEEK